MATRKRDYERVWVSIPKEFNAQLEQLSKKMVISKSMLMNMSAQAGLKLILRSISPEDAFTPDQWADIALAFEKKAGQSPLLPVRKAVTRTTR